MIMIRIRDVQTDVNNQPGQCALVFGVRYGFDITRPTSAAVATVAKVNLAYLLFFFGGFVFVV